MNKITVFLAIVIIALGFSLVVTKQCKAENKSFAGVIPFISPTGGVGFLDQTNGRLYLYDSNITQCVYIGQIQTLGQPIQVLSSNPGANL